MSTVKHNINHLNQLILEGKAMEGFELYYDDDVVMQENETQPIIGKAANRERERDFFGRTRFHHVEVLGVTYGDNLTSVIWHFDYTHPDWGVRNYTQVAVQHWKDGKIVKEQFFYGN